MRALFTSIADFMRRGLAYAHRNHLRPYLPRTAPVLHAGCPSMLDYRLFDRVLPVAFRPAEIVDVPDYEEQLVNALRKVVKPGHRVVVVGGGWGTTAVVAAKMAGPHGHVWCFEASAEQLPMIRETFRRNGVNVDLQHAAVGEAIGVYGSGVGVAEVVSPESLPECDVLELDCEGAERIILEQMSIRPAVIAVETHGVFGASTADINRTLERLGYDVTDLGVAEPRMADHHRNLDVHVLLAVRRSDR